MRRQLSLIQDREFDLLVVGGGVVGSCVAWDAAQRGLSVALIERRDFASGTSSNSLKIVHGGLRYLQRLNVRMLRESIRERGAWLRIAPHLVEPLPVVVPDYGDRRENRHLLRTALLVNDLLSADRNEGADDDRQLPGGSLLSAAECREWVPSLPQRGLRGGVLFYDAQMYSSERLVIEVLRSAVKEGAVVLNYMEMVRSQSTAAGLSFELRDSLTGHLVEARAKFLINAAGPWLPETISAVGGGARAPNYAAALNLVLAGRGDRAAVALSTRDADSNGSFRRLFMVPWRGRSLIGTAHYHVEGGATPHMDARPFEHRFLDEVNRALPFDPIGTEEVLRSHFGLLPVEGGEGDASADLLREPRLIEHPGPVISVASVKYTGARALSERVVDRVVERLGRAVSPCRTGSTRLPGVPGGSTAELIGKARRKYGAEFDAEVLEHLVRVYGTGYEDVLRIAGEGPELAGRVVPDAPVLRAQLEHGVRSEMAVRVDDLLYRRTELGAVGSPSPDAVLAAESSLGR